MLIGFGVKSKAAVPAGQRDGRRFFEVPGVGGEARHAAAGRRDDARD